MLCAPIKLSNRSLKQGEIDANKYRSKLLDERHYMKSDYYHSYTFRWDRSKKFIKAPPLRNQCVAVNNILLPENVSTFNTGSSLKRWSNKRPRLKSCKNKSKSHRDTSPKDTESEDTFNIAALVKQFSRELEVEEEDELYEELEEIDPDIQRLISISQGSSTDHDDDDGHKHRKKHKKKDKNDLVKVKKTKVKAIRFSLSKPPSPQTVQVIRVDVTSNYSIEVIEADNAKETINDCSKGCGKRIRSGLESRKAMLKKQYSIHGEDGDEIDFLCKRLTLMERSDDEK